MTTKPLELYFCPRCDRYYANFENLKKHVTDQHPDHDPAWYETHRDSDCKD